MKVPQKETWINPKIEIREAGVKGKGMFTTAPIKIGETVLIWGGQYTTDAEGAKKAKAKGKLVMRWDENLYSVEDRGEDLGYFINHSCDSNTWMQDAYTLIARHNIKKDEEVTADYALWANSGDPSDWECKCGLPICRKRVTGKDWKLPEAQKRYKGHFSPLLNKKIEKLRQ